MKTLLPVWSFHVDCEHYTQLVALKNKSILYILEVIIIIR